MLVVMLAGWVNEQHRAVNAYLKEENRVLRELHGKKRLRSSMTATRSTHEAFTKSSATRAWLL